jgi:mRNA-degrading endonuclease RelE of RelBE toxin-antitoxin system
MWRVVVDPRVDRSTRRFPQHDRERIFEAINRMAENPLLGDVKKLGPDGYRRRVGSYRIFFELQRNQGVVFVSRVERRTSTTY